jgi:NADPH-dependent 2,4-dienoyl-CoA reductase/sulfur reductase-like enzyme/nitrite reductase/ring-hydroxylating ferredoxin subunit
MSSEEQGLALADLQEGAMRSVQVQGKPVLLVRSRDRITAIGATCPHAGANLAEGVLDGDRVICPWHKAAFCVRTGRLLDPPAVDPVPVYRVRQENGRILVDEPEAPPSEDASAPDERCFVIVGAGAAGAVAAQTLREVGFGGRIVMLDRENRVPYDRTVLSKYALSGETGAEKSPLQKQDFYRAHRIERLTEEVTRLDAAARRIECASGAVYPYDAALVATGGVPARPSLPGIGLGNIFVLRSRADADAVLAQAERSRTAVVLGAGFIGMEVAASLRERGLEVTVVAQEAAPFEKQLGADIGGAFTALHESRGVNFRFRSKVRALSGAGRVRGVTLESGEELAADLVVIGFGVRPATGFLNGVTIEEDGGVNVDRHLHAADHLYVAGDIARFPLMGDGHGVRVEHWRVAQQHGRVAALNMAGKATPYDQVPVFWTIQYLKRLDYIGHCEQWDELVIHGDLKKPAFLAYYVRDGRVAAAAGLGRDQDTAALIALFEHHRNWTPADLGPEPSKVLAGFHSRK